jgi:hypothetical protein
MSGDEMETPPADQPREPYVRKTAAEREELAQEIWAGRIFTSQHVRDPGDISMVFMVLAFLDNGFRDWALENNIAVLYEEMSKAGPRGVNGYPCFFSMKMLDKEDAQAVFDRVREIQAFMDARTKDNAE